MAQVEQKQRTSIQLKEDIDNIRVGFICIEGDTYSISPAITACILDMLNEIEELENLLSELKNHDNVARS
ncbi:hypothetical protein [Methylophaga sp.]|jgi:hypothetical protein|uniref:hypothetical protein n=1 Tax=Methylophaga sp. TaxID=2024840 RepID=UPI000C4C244A|nr:hypothetical protein [Methylophaga sp.]MBP25473.1 hypothetical protein [Methylophaga sp.]MDP7580969.1 hypothetical protein [Nitrospinota bacterium]|tara:strand:+ start:1309 stop:1518 length:210 start_codon:yes stop_codon:yes gene_type:complete